MISPSKVYTTADATADANAVYSAAKKTWIYGSSKEIWQREWGTLEAH